MKVLLNFSTGESIEIAGCVYFYKMVNQEAYVFLFGELSERARARVKLEYSGIDLKITEFSDEEYSSPQSYRLLVTPNNPETKMMVNVTDGQKEYMDLLEDGKMMFVLLHNDTSKKFTDMKCLDISDKNELRWTDEYYPNSIVTCTNKRDEKLKYFTSYHKNNK